MDNSLINRGGEMVESLGRKQFRKSWSKRLWWNLGIWYII